VFVFKRKTKHLPALVVNTENVHLSAISAYFTHKFEIWLKVECTHENNYLNSKLEQVHNHIIGKSINVELHEDDEENLIDENSYIQPE
jgi:hypothetical protein